LDVLLNRHPHYENSRLIWKMCLRKQAEGHISALTFANVIYVMRRTLIPERREYLLGALSSLFRFERLTFTDLQTAAKMKWRDFEDAVQSATASRINADYIITRNTKDFENSTVKALTPEEYFSEVFTVEG
ncbi:MAG: PIN domain-containing protein, partial [Synergistaceae bacterium]|nr:PIN domain-containing protein [Synergistaceae bacterium]